MKKLLVFVAIGVLVVAAAVLSKLRGGGEAKEIAVNKNLMHDVPDIKQLDEDKSQ